VADTVTSLRREIALNAFFELPVGIRLHILLSFHLPSYLACILAELIDMHSSRSLPFTYEHSSIAPPPSSVSSPSYQVPIVFVHPPEDEAMPWCAFDGGYEDADSQMAFTTPEMEEVLQALLDDQSHPVHSSPKNTATFGHPQADGSVITRRRGSSHSSLPANRNPLPRLSVIPESPKRAKERDDDDIVEIMKVRRGEGMPDVAYANGSVAPIPTLRRSKTLRSRAAQALRSIKNVGKAPRTRPTMEHVIPAKENGVTGAAKAKAPAHTCGQVPPPTADKHRAKAVPFPSHSSLPRLKKRVSQPLSNLFGLGPGGLEASPDGPVASDETGVGASPSHSHSRGFRTLPYSRSASASTSALQMFSDVPARPTSPSFSIRSTARQKLSFVNLQSIFSGSTHTPNASEEASEPQQAEANPEVDEPAPLPCAAQMPVDEDEDDDGGWDSGEDYDSPRRNVDPSGTLRRPRPREGSCLEEREFSFEMRLNSMHFDSFSFDADAF
jgi:hypothetical protein